MRPALHCAAVLATMACTAPDLEASTAPTIGDGDRVHLVMLGDVGSDTRERLEVLEGLRQRCADDPCDAVVLLGDLLYPRGADSPVDPRLEAFVGVYADIAPVYLLVGNHDYGHGRDHEAVAHVRAWAATRDDVHLPSTVYEATLGDHLGTLAVLDTNHIFQHGDTSLGSRFPSQGAWLDHLAARDGPLLVVGHHPFRSNGPHGNAGRYEGWRYLPWASGRVLERFFVEHVAGEAVLYAAGHDHNLQLLPCDDTTCAVAGSGAKVRELVDRGNRTHFQASTPGFVDVELSRDGAYVSACGADGQVLARVPLPLPD